MSTVRVNLLSGEKLTVEADSVAALFARIETANGGAPVSALVYAGRTLEITRPITQYFGGHTAAGGAFDVYEVLLRGRNWTTTVVSRAAINKTEKAADAFPVTIKFFTGRTLVVHVAPHTTVGTFRAIVALADATSQSAQLTGPGAIIFMAHKPSPKSLTETDDALTMGELGVTKDALFAVGKWGQPFSIIDGPQPKTAATAPATATAAAAETATAPAAATATGAAATATAPATAAVAAPVVADKPAA